MIIYHSIGDNRTTYENLPDEEKDKIRSILYIMDRFSISLDGYHELTQLEKSLPRTHEIESCAKALNREWDIKRTPGEAHGAELPFPLLLRKEITDYVSYTSMIYARSF